MQESLRPPPPLLRSPTALSGRRSRDLRNKQRRQCSSDTPAQMSKRPLHVCTNDLVLKKSARVVKLDITTIKKYSRKRTQSFTSILKPTLNSMTMKNIDYSIVGGPWTMVDRALPRTPSPTTVKKKDTNFTFVKLEFVTFFS